LIDPKHVERQTTGIVLSRTGDAAPAFDKAVDDGARRRSVTDQVKVGLVLDELFEFQRCSARWWLETRVDAYVNAREAEH
jgi:hypothetical protein